ncbi:hypothetical protein EV191_1011345 [Tamaricihabitans halophyticus]|uniref:Uncharacterized protein n=1 Tax=Tamaricihabitans halophyticus TaxID=1262583 RepID=A0A4R2R3I9_9PSEU|nr:hypothetical protein [Tamaricihabitans halophyticus]TCP57390.1 hypothetical protein EV191_1011345 [Tamaricihabitans halophyticus]
MPESRSRLASFSLTKSGLIAVAVLLVFVAGFAGAGQHDADRAGTSASNSVMGTAYTTLSPQLRGRVTKSQDAAQDGRQYQAWQQIGMRLISSRTERAGSCTANSYGRLQRFFQRTPCQDLDRMVLRLRDPRGSQLNVAVSWIRMPNPALARELRALADAEDAGNVAPIGSTGPYISGAQAIGVHHQSLRNGTHVVLAEAAPGDALGDAERMRAATKVAVTLPEP